MEYSCDMDMPYGSSVRGKCSATAEEISLGFGNMTTLDVEIPAMGQYKEHKL